MPEHECRAHPASAPAGLLGHGRTDDTSDHDDHRGATDHHRRAAPKAGREPVATIRRRSAEHRAILTMGDSLMGGRPTLERVLSAHGFDAVVYDSHVPARRLLDDERFSVAKCGAQLSAHPDVDTVVFGGSGSVSRARRTVCAMARPASSRG
jgi:hypothetical protein